MSDEMNTPSSLDLKRVDHWRLLLSHWGSVYDQAYQEIGG